MFKSNGNLSKAEALPQNSRYLFLLVGVIVWLRLLLWFFSARGEDEEDNKKWCPRQVQSRLWKQHFEW